MTPEALDRFAVAGAPAKTDFGIAGRCKRATPDTAPTPEAHEEEAARQADADSARAALAERKPPRDSDDCPFDPAHYRIQTL